MEQSGIHNEKRFSQLYVRSALGEMANREEGRKEWKSMERKITMLVNQFLF